MVGSGAIQFLPLSPPETLNSITQLFRGGQSRPGLVVAGSDGPVLHVAGLRIPIPKSAGAFEAGQRVLVTLLNSGQTPTLRVAPQPPAQPPASPPPQAPTALLSKLLESLGVLSQQNLSAASAIVPTNVALPEQALRALMALFAARQNAGRALATISTLLQTALAAGAVSSEAVQIVEKLAARMKATDAGAFREAIATVREAAGKPAEARLAQLVLSGASSDIETVLRGSLYAELSRLSNDRKLAAFLKSNGQLAAFESAMEGLLEQLRGGEVHRARAAEIPYQFIDLPLNPQSGFDRVHLHFFGDGGAEDDDAAPSTSLLVFDLSLSRLGDMWITLRTTPNACSCRIQTCDPNAAATIDEHAHELSRALTDAGYPGTVVEAAAWEGDRFDAVADLFRNASGLDLSA